jgi:hypothetical protein
MSFDGFPHRVRQPAPHWWFHELPGDPLTVDGAAVVWPVPDRSDHSVPLSPLVIPGQRRSPEDW